jgi:hypothetical protein
VIQELQDDKDNDKHNIDDDDDDNDDGMPRLPTVIHT